jgi:hypothetical protein
MTRLYREYTDDQFIDAVKHSTSISQILKALGLSLTGGNFKLARERIKKIEIDDSHLMGQGYLKGKTHNWTKSIPLKNILTKNSSYNRGHLKARLIKEGIFEDKCYECNLTEWQEKPLTMQIEHKNGVNNDNRLENLTLLCPNCHSQTKTFAGRNTKKTKKEYYCTECRKKITRCSKSGLCVKCVKIKK